MNNSRHERTPQRISTALVALASVTVPALAAPIPAAAPATDDTNGAASFLRVADDRDRSISLEIASREFVHPDDGRPRVGLVSVAHIADGSFYEAIQELLDQYDVVLFEAVRPAGAGSPSGETPAERAAATQASMQLAASVIEAYRQARERSPADLDSVRAYAEASNPLLANWFTSALTDAWGEPLRYETDDLGTTYRLRSLGADGRDGGEGAEADLEVSAEDGVAPLRLPRDGLQEQLAAALGLEFQLASLNYAAPHWRSSDMDMATLIAAFRERGLDFAPLGDTLAGTSLPAQVTKLLLGAVRMLDSMAGGAVSDTMKVLMIEMLSDETLIEASMGQMGEGFSEVIVDLRNQVVIDDLAAIIANEPHVESVAILYGAAHMPDFAERLQRQLGYEPVAEARWLPAITVNLTESRADSGQLKQMRMMIRRMMRQQFQR